MFWGMRTEYRYNPDTLLLLLLLLLLKQTMVFISLRMLKTKSGKYGNR